jgi:hypothetical protein
MRINEFDVVRLKDGREGTIIDLHWYGEKLGHGYLFEWHEPQEELEDVTQYDWDNEFISFDDIVAVAKPPLRKLEPVWIAKPEILRVKGQGEILHFTVDVKPEIYIGQEIFDDQGNTYAVKNILMIRYESYEETQKHLDIKIDAPLKEKYIVITNI